MAVCRADFTNVSKLFLSAITLKFAFSSDRPEMAEVDKIAEMVSVASKSNSVMPRWCLFAWVELFIDGTPLPFVPLHPCSSCY
jgi:hypothetical protein